MTFCFFSENCQILRLLVPLTLMTNGHVFPTHWHAMIIPGVMILYFSNFYVASLQHGWKED